MNRKNIFFSLLWAAILGAIALFSVNCMGTGTTSGSIRLNISDQPVWGPTGYDRAEYYYIPDIDVYYSVSDRQYIYREGADWKYAPALPSAYSSYDPYHSYKVVIDEDKPYRNNESHRARYKSYKGMKDQQIIRDSHDRKYFVNKDHPEHDKWVQEQKH